MTTKLVVPHPPTFGSPEEPPTVQDVLDLLHDLDQARCGGLADREEFQARKKELLARIRRGRS